MLFPFMPGPLPLRPGLVQFLLGFLHREPGPLVLKPLGLQLKLDPLHLMVRSPQLMLGPQSSNFSHLPRIHYVLFQFAIE